MPLTTAVNNQMQDHLLGGPDYVREATVHIGVSSTPPTTGGTGITEPVGGAYVRVAITNNATNFPSSAGNGNVKSNGTLITFPTASATWLLGVNLTYVVIFNHATAATPANVLAYGPITTPQPVMATNTLSIPIGALDLQFA